MVHWRACAEAFAFAVWCCRLVRLTPAAFAAVVSARCGSECGRVVARRSAAAVAVHLI